MDPRSPHRLASNPPKSDEAGTFDGSASPLKLHRPKTSRKLFATLCRILTAESIAIAYLLTSLRNTGTTEGESAWFYLDYIPQPCFALT